MKRIKESPSCGYSTYISWNRIQRVGLRCVEGNYFTSDDFYPDCLSAGNTKYWPRRKTGYSQRIGEEPASHERSQDTYLLRGSWNFYL